MRVDLPPFGVLLLGAAALLQASCALPINTAAGILSPRQPAKGAPRPLVEPGVIAVPAVDLPAALAAEPVTELAPDQSAPATDTPPDVAAAAVTRPYADEVERWRPQVRQLLAEARREGRLSGAAGVIDEDLVLAVIEQESSGDREAESEAGALGLMQLMPETFAYFMGLHAWGDDVDDVDRSAILDVPSNLRAGLRCLAGVLDEQDGSLYWALASYNAGGGMVNRWRAAGFSTVPAWREETANYPTAILRNYAVHHRDPAAVRPPSPAAPVPAPQVAPAPVAPQAAVRRAPALAPAVAASRPVQPAPATRAVAPRAAAPRR